MLNATELTVMGYADDRLRMLAERADMSRGLLADLILHRYAELFEVYVGHDELPDVPELKGRLVKDFTVEDCEIASGHGYSAYIADGRLVGVQRINDELDMRIGFKAMEETNG